MTQEADLTAREAEVIRILRVLSSQSNRFVVIGGHAVSALGSHRLSVDADIVLPEKQLNSFEKILGKEGYKKVKLSDRLKGTHGAKTVRYVKLIGGRRVSVDLYVNAVICRDTLGEWSHELLLQNSVEANVVGVTDSTLSRVPKRELLIAMKLHPARDTDLRDVVMLGEEADWAAVADFASTGTRSKVIAQLESAITRIESREFPSALRAEFGLRTNVTSLIRGTVEHLSTVRNMLFGKKARHQ